jgi:hypothetical protein
MSNFTKFTPPHPLNTAVLFLVFNRLDTTKQVFEAIRQAKPPRLYVAADGARKNKEGEDKKVQEVRDFIMSNIDWNCEVKTLFREQNYGCKMAVSGAIDWFFENEEMGIILEDDCLPSQSFFWFCEELLERYKDDNRISLITGTSYLFNEIDSKDDYFYSKYISIWGWATWNRSWKQYDVEMKDWPKLRENNFLESVFFWDKNIQNIFSKYFDMGYEKKIDTWDFQWAFRCLAESGYCITPYKNLVSNIGIEGTRSSQNSPFVKMHRLDIIDVKHLKCSFPIVHNYKIDKILFYNVFNRFTKHSYMRKLIEVLGLKPFVKKIYGAFIGDSQ